MDSQDGLDQPTHLSMVVFNFTKKRKYNIMSTNYYKMRPSSL